MPQKTVGTTYDELWDTAQDGPAIAVPPVDLTTARSMTPATGENEVIPANKPMLLKSNGKTYAKVASGTATVQVYPI